MLAKSLRSNAPGLLMSHLSRSRRQIKEHLLSSIFDNASRALQTAGYPHQLLRHSTLRSTLDVYTQAITPAKHAAQAVVLSLVFSCAANETSQSSSGDVAA
jgi:hypothetical protein